MYGFCFFYIFNKYTFIYILEQMSANHAEDIYIPSVFVSENTGKTIIYNYQYDEGFALVLTDEIPFNINTHLILPFAVVIGMCFIIMVKQILLFIYRLCWLFDITDCIYDCTLRTWASPHAETSSTGQCFKENSNNQIQQEYALRNVCHLFRWLCRGWKASRATVSSW